MSEWVLVCLCLPTGLTQSQLAAGVQYDWGRVNKLHIDSSLP